MRYLHVMLVVSLGMTMVPFCSAVQKVPDADEYGRTPVTDPKDEKIRSDLRTAVRAGEVGVVKTLIEGLPDVEITRRIGLFDPNEKDPNTKEPIIATAWQSAAIHCQCDVLKLFIPYLNDIALAEILRKITMYRIPDKIKKGREEIARLIYSKTKYHTIYDATTQMYHSPYDIIIKELERAVVDKGVRLQDAAYLVEAKKLLEKISYEALMSSCTVDVLQYNLAKINEDIARNEGILKEEVFCPTCKANYLRYVHAGCCPTCHQGDTHARLRGSVEENISDAKVKKAVIEALLEKSGQEVKQPQRPAAEEHKDPVHVPAPVQVPEWACPSCTYLNSNTRATCGMCEAKRPF
ncbi:MAG: Ran-binding zinc finger domain-containing protein [Candidatus Babeliales bacterium]|jgi:hypothetical protein